jgi:hypothetical protein
MLAYKNQCRYARMPVTIHVTIKTLTKWFSSPYFRGLDILAVWHIPACDLTVVVFLLGIFRRAPHQGGALVPFSFPGAPLCPFPSQGAPCPLKKKKFLKKSYW